MTRQIRVLFLDHTARLSGAEIAMAKLVSALKTTEVFVILGDDGPLVQLLRDRGVKVKVLSLPERTRDRHRFELARNPVATFSDLSIYLVRLARAVRLIKPDIIHTNSLKANFYGGVLARVLGIPQVWHARDIAQPPYVSARVALLIRVAARLLPRVVIANSRATARALGARTAGVILPSPIVDVHEMGRFEGSRSSVDHVRFVMVGRLAQWKGQDVVIDAFDRSMRNSPHTLTFIGSAMFGEDEYADELLTQVKTAGLQGQVNFLGFQPNVNDLLANYDVLVHYSVSPEPFGQVIVEGMAAGLCVIAADEGGPSDIVTDGVDGILVPPRSPGLLDSALVRVTESTNLRVSLGQKAMLSSQRFSADLIGPQTERLYANILADS